MRSRAPFEAGQYVERIAEQIRGDRHALFAPELQLDDRHIQSAVAATWCAAARLENELRERARTGRIVEAHGDLKPEHICMTDPPCVIDALEFSRDLRLLDPAEGLGYLWVECERLLSFYRSRRAMVRAKIVAWHLLDPVVMSVAPWRELTHVYLATAESYARLAV